MKSKQFIIVAVLLAGIAGVSAETLSAAIRVDENHPIKAVDNRLLGFHHFPRGGIPVCEIPGAAGYNSNIAATLDGLSLPLNRLSFLFNWKGAIGPYAQRTEQKLADWWPAPQKIGYGPVEWIQMCREIDPAAGFIVIIDLLASTNDTADLVEFLTGDGLTNPNGGTNWAQVRMDCGITSPVAVDVWELGNEMDMDTNLLQNITAYTDLCSIHIDAIRSVQPDAKISPLAATLSMMTAYKTFYGDGYNSWINWHQTVLREIGDDIDYLAFHVYYNSLPASSMESKVGTIAADIRLITGSDRIKIYISEHAWWPKTPEAPPYSPQWSDSWYTTHALLGCLGNADWVTRMMNSPAMELATSHAFCGGPWGLIYKSGIGDNLYTTGIADLYELLLDAFRDGISIVPVDVSGTNTDRTLTNCLFTAAALTTSDGVNLILVNRDETTDRSVDLNFQRQYALVEKSLFTAPDILSYNTSTNRPIRVSRDLFPSGESLSGITVPAKSLVVLKLKSRAVSAAKIVK